MLTPPQIVCQTRPCLCCGKPFEVRRREHIYCSDNCRWRHKGKRNPEALTKSRQRCAEWARVNRNVRGENRWLRAAPPFGEYLPGAGFTLDVSPQPKWPVVHRNIRGVHGMVTELLGVGHHETMPVFTLMPSNVGLRWAAFVADESVARRVAGRSHAGVLYDREVTIRCGHLTRVRSPKIVKRGHRKLRIDALTPVQIRNTTGRKSDNPRVTVHSMPTSGNLCSTMALMLARRLGVDLRVDDIALKIYERHCQFRTVQLGDKFGNVGGFVGHMIIDTNATGHWLLKCAETMGLGGRTSFGFGRIQVEEL